MKVCNSGDKTHATMIQRHHHRLITKIKWARKLSKQQMSAQGSYTKTAYDWMITETPATKKL